MTAHVVGAGLAGLAAAVALTSRGQHVALYEAAPRAGGRCRSYFDPHLGCTIDNGGHLILGANRNTFAFLDRIGSRAELDTIVPAAFPFLDLTTGAQWSVRPNTGALPWWIFSEARRVPKTRPIDYLRLATLWRAGPSDTVAHRIRPTDRLYERLIEPLATAIMNAAPDEAAARPLARVLYATLCRGERACRPSIARHGLSRTFVDPALAWLAQRGAVFHPSTRVERFIFAGGRIDSLATATCTVPMEPGDTVVVAVPPWIAASLLPGLVHPIEHRSIVNAHFRLKRPVRLPGGAPLLGLLGGTAQWLIARDDVVSVTISAADVLLDRPAPDLLDGLWQDTAVALGEPRAITPPARLVKERRATFAQTPAAERLRPGPRTAWRNVFLAGDWTATGLPATIEGAILSGNSAAAAVCAAAG